MKTIHHHR